MKTEQTTRAGVSERGGGERRGPGREKNRTGNIEYTVRTLAVLQLEIELPRHARRGNANSSLSLTVSQPQLNRAPKIQSKYVYWE